MKEIKYIILYLVTVPVPLVKKLRFLRFRFHNTLPVELLLAVDVLTYQLPHQVVLGALLPPSQAPQLLSRALRAGDIRTGLKIWLLYNCILCFCDFCLGIWIRGSMPLTYGSGFGAGSCYFWHCPSRWQQKLFFKTFFCWLLFKGTFTSFFKDKKSKKSGKAVHCKKEWAVFPSPTGMSLIKLFLGGNNLVFSRPERDW